MFTYKKLAVLGLSVLLGVPSVSMAGSFTLSLIQGKTPAEAVQIIAEQIDLLTGRVATLETKQSDTELEIERLKLENENLRLKTDEVLSDTAETRANEARRRQCSELAAQIGTKEDAIRSPFEVQIVPLEKQLRDLKAGNGTTVVADAETQALLNRLEKGEELGDFTQEERDKIRTYQSQQQNTLVSSLNEIKKQKEQLEEKINAIEVEMEKAIEALHSTVEVKALQTQLDNLLCA
jgi:chromosome segregation ATPase